MRQAFFVDMSHKTKRKDRATIAATRRWATRSVPISAEDSDEEIVMDLNDFSEKEQLEFSLGGTSMYQILEIYSRLLKIRHLYDHYRF